MIPKVVSFDCADTLVQLGWHPFHAMRDCAELANLSFPEGAFRVYGDLFVNSRREYEEVNLTRDVEALDRYWEDLTLRWLREIGASVDHAEVIRQSVGLLAYGPDSPWFGLFSDVADCMAALEQMGVRKCVVSNWDLSLDRVLRSHGLAERFELIVASLAEGVEKPDPGLFRIALDRLGVEPGDVVHIGDNPIDDIEGAAAAGIPSLLIDRRLTASSRENRTLATLDDLPEALTWNA